MSQPAVGQRAPALNSTDFTHQDESIGHEDFDSAFENSCTASSVALEGALSSLNKTTEVTSTLNTQTQSLGNKLWAQSLKNVSVYEAAEATRLWRFRKNSIKGFWCLIHTRDLQPHISAD